MSAVIYVSEYTNYDPLNAEGKSIVNIKGKKGFNAYPVFDPVKGLVNKGVLVIDSETDAKLITELEAFPDFGKGFVKVDKLPLQANADGNITGVRTGHEEIKPMTEHIKQALGAKFKRYYELKDVVLKKDGSLKLKGDDPLVTEYEELEIELFPNGGK